MLAATCMFLDCAELNGPLSQAELRRQLSGERKRTTKLEAAQTKLQSLYETRIVDLKALRTALSNREDQLKVLPGCFWIDVLCQVQGIALRTNTVFDLFSTTGCVSTTKGTGRLTCSQHGQNGYRSCSHDKYVTHALSHNPGRL